MTIRFTPKGYQPTKREQYDSNINSFDRRVEKALDYLSAGFTSERQFINEIKVAHSNYKHNQKRINELERMTMIDVNGVCFKPIKKVTELTNTAIYEDNDGYRYIVKPDKHKRTQAVIKLEQERAKTGLSMRKFGMSIGVASATYIRWQRKGRVPDNELGVRTLMNVFGVSENEAIELIEEG